MDNKSFTIRVSKRWVRIATIVGVTALIVAPLTAVAGHVFNDVPGSHTFHNDITWLADAGVTKGCNPPTNDEFCPDDNVTRGQMAAFQRRFAQYIDAEDGTPAQADNATTADSAMTAAEADTLDGKDSSDFLEECSAGSIGAYVKVDVSETTAALDLAGVVDSYACTGTDVLVARQFTGRYAVVIDGGSETSIGQTGGFDAPIGGISQSFGENTVSVSGPFQLNFSTPPFWIGWDVNIRDNDGLADDEDFTVIIPANGQALSSQGAEDLLDAPTG